MLSAVLPDGLPSPCAVLILADPGAGKEFLTTEMLSAHLGKGYQVLWVSLENFAETLRNMVDSVSFATQSNPSKGRLAFVDCYSSQIGVKSRERYSADPNNLPNLSIVTSVAISETSKETRLLVVLDSLSALIQKVGIRPATEFFRMLVAKTRSLNADFLATLNRKAFSLETIALFQEVADCVIELMVKENHVDIDHYIRIRKMMRRNSSSNWIPYEIDSENCVLVKSREHAAIPVMDLGLKPVNTTTLGEEISLVREREPTRLSEANNRPRLDEMFAKYGKGATLEEAERLAAIGQAVAMIGHDLRNPLQVIINKIYLARMRARASPNALSEGFLRELEEQIKRMNELVAGLQDYSKFDPTLVDVDARRLIDETLAAIAVPDSVKLSVEVAGDLPKIKADHGMMSKALANVINNATQAMPDGGKLTIRAFRDNGSLTITVEDSGFGIAKESLGKVFTPLYTTKADSTGIGLAISKRFVESHNGTIEVESEVGKGSIFTIKLPLA